MAKSFATDIPPMFKLGDIRRTGSILTTLDD
jgi:hypothetical protein